MKSQQNQEVVVAKMSIQKTIRLVIADDRLPAREGLKALLSAPDPSIGKRIWNQESLPIQVIAEACDGIQAVQLVNLLRPDVVIMDVLMPGLNGIQATRLIKSKFPEVGIIILSFYGAHRGEAMNAGADAFFLKGCSPETLLECLVKIGLRLGG